MLKEISYEKKIELLERQINEVTEIEYDDDRARKIHIFKSRTKQILKRIFLDSDEYISHLEEISFNSVLYLLDIHSDPSDDYSSFQDGITNTETLLKSAISNVELEKELSEEENEPNIISQKTVLNDKTKVFIVHGHDDGLKHEVALFIQRLGLEAIILHEQVSRGNTIIEKIEANSDVGFAIVLYTPCDIGRSLKSEEDHPRARQNVIFEHGYFVAKLGRQNVVALNKGNVEIPNDLSGVVYTSYDEYGAWKKSIAHELNDSGYKIDFSKV